MLFKVKYIGSAEPSLTVNTVYTVASMWAFDQTFTLINGGSLYITNSPMNSTGNWVVESIEYPGLVKLFP